MKFSPLAICAGLLVAAALAQNSAVQAPNANDDVLLRAMENLYGLFGQGPASAVHPSSGNWSSIYAGAAARTGSAVPTNAA